MFTGIKLYLVLLFGIAGWGYIEHQRAELATKDAETFKAQRDSLRTSLVQAEADKAQLVKQQADTDAIVAAQRETERKLQNEKAQVWAEFDRVIASTPKADQDCASRELPPPVLDFLRDGPIGHDAVPAGQDPGKSPPAVPGK